MCFSCGGNLLVKGGLLGFSHVSSEAYIMRYGTCTQHI